MNQTKYKQLFELSPIATALLDFETCNFLEVNKAFEELTQYTKEELLNLSYWDITPKECMQEYEELRESLKNTGKFEPIEKQYLKKDGKKYHVRLNGFLLKENKNEQVWLQLEDITRQKQNTLITQDNKELLEYIAVEDSLPNVLQKIVEYAEKRSPNSKCSIFLADDEKKHLISTVASSLPKFYNEVFNRIKIDPKVGSCGSAAFHEKRVIVENIDEHENWKSSLKFTRKANLHACWSQPIFSLKKELLGTFAIYFDEPKKPTKFEIKLIESYANLASKAIEKELHLKDLEEKRQELEDLFQNTLSGLVYVSQNRVLIKANQRAAEILGYENANDMTNLKMEDIHISKENYKEFGEKNVDSLAYQINFNIEYQFKKKDGTTVWCEVSGKALDKNIPADLSKGVLWTVNDISLRKKFQQKLLDSQTLNKNILTTLPHLVWLKDKEGKYLSCNKAFEIFFGEKESEIIGKTDYDFEPKEIADGFRKHDKIAMNSKDVVINEEWVTFPSGEEILLETSKKALNNENGEIIGVLGSAINITKRKKREKELEDLNKLANELTNSQNTLLSLFDKGDSVLFLWNNNENWDIEYVSQSVKKLFEYTENDFTSGQIIYTDSIDKRDIKRVLTEVYDAIEKKLDYFSHKPYRIKTKSGKIKWILDSTVTRKDKEGNIIKFISYLFDITEQIKNQEIIYHQSKIASMGEMLGNISHQWRQPLSAISTVSSGIKLKNELEMLTNDDIDHSMNIISEHVSYLSKTIEDFRSFFDSDTKTKKEVNLKNSIDVTYTLIKDALKAYNIKCLITSTDVKKVCNENMFIQAILNIFNNAQDAIKRNRRFEEKNYIFIELKENENNIILTIKDNAGGVSDELIKKIFEPYFTTKHQSQGTGIGLYMTNQIITKHLDGEIIVKNEKYTYENETYNGACFEIKIPN